jgi:hypothetical protein
MSGLAWGPRALLYHDIISTLKLWTEGFEWPTGPKTTGKICTYNRHIQAKDSLLRQTSPKTSVSKSPIFPKSIPKATASSSRHSLMDCWTLRVIHHHIRCFARTAVAVNPNLILLKLVFNGSSYTMVSKSLLPEILTSEYRSRRGKRTCVSIF